MRVGGQNRGLKFGGSDSVQFPSDAESDRVAQVGCGYGKSRRYAVRIEFYLSQDSSHPFGGDERREPGLAFPSARPSKHCHREHAASPPAARYLTHGSFHQIATYASRGFGGSPRSRRTVGVVRKHG